MSEGRSVAQRKADTRAALEKQGDLWLGTADPSGKPHLIAVSAWWNGKHVIIATTAGSRTARNLDATGIARLALGSPADAIMVDAAVADHVKASEADARAFRLTAAMTNWKGEM